MSYDQTCCPQARAVHSWSGSIRLVVTLRGVTVPTTGDTVQIGYASSGNFSITDDQNHPATVVSNVFSVSGTGSDIYLLDVSVDAALVSDPSQLNVIWENPSNGIWEPACEDNTPSGLPYADGPFNLDADSFFTGIGGADSDFVPNLGAYGYYAEPNGTDDVWVVIDHNSTFSVASFGAPVPGPTSLSLLALGSLGLLARWRRI